MHDDLIYVGLTRFGSARQVPIGLKACAKAGLRSAGTRVSRPATPVASFFAGFRMKLT